MEKLINVKVTVIVTTGKISSVVVFYQQFVRRLPQYPLINHLLGKLCFIILIPSPFINNYSYHEYNIFLFVCFQNFSYLPFKAYYNHININIVFVLICTFANMRIRNVNIKVICCSNSCILLFEFWKQVLIVF